MRPRRARLGCSGQQVWGTTATSSFNEAEARAPRMRRTPNMEQLGNSSFNEAEARAPRMRVFGVVTMQAVTSASMRPRRARLGCHEHLLMAAITNRRFNEAEARAPRMR